MGLEPTPSCEGAAPVAETAKCARKPPNSLVLRQTAKVGFAIFDRLNVTERPVRNSGPNGFRSRSAVLAVTEHWFSAPLFIRNQSAASDYHHSQAIRVLRVVRPIGCERALTRLAASAIGRKGVDLTVRAIVMVGAHSRSVCLEGRDFHLRMRLAFPIYCIDGEWSGSAETFGMVVRGDMRGANGDIRRAGELR